MSNRSMKWITCLTAHDANVVTATLQILLVVNAKSLLAGGVINHARRDPSGKMTQPIVRLDY